MEEYHTLWLPHNAIVQLIDDSVVRNFRISEKYFKTADLIKKMVCREFQHTTQHGAFASQGKITMLEAKLKAESEYDKFRVIQDQNYESDFDRELQKRLKKN